MKLLGVFIWLMISSSMFSQSIDELRWKNRLVILVGSEQTILSNVEAYNDIDGLKERRLIVLVKEKNQLIGNKDGQQVSFAIPDFLNEEDGFYLVGLDGALKRRQKLAMSQKELFAIIDSMPMRANEMRHGNE